MDIDFTFLISGIKQEINIDQSIEIPTSYFQTSEIRKLENVNLQGTFTINQDNEISLTGLLTGNMYLLDSISLEEEKMPFSIELDEILPENTENQQINLDIIEVLWQNIMLEAPIKFTKVDDFSKYQGDGWKLLKEEEVNQINNPFNDLMNMMGEE